MDFRPDPEIAAFRRELQAFLAAELPADLRAERRDVRSAAAEIRRWQAILQARGWGAPGWSTTDGGTGWTVEQQVVFEEECAQAGAPTQDGFAQKLLGPVLNHFGSLEQKAEHASAILSGERMWCQGFSEPGAGSDLAALRTRAERRGDRYVLNGQKTWSSYAHEADWMFVLARTDQDAAKHAGISFLLVDLRSPGVSVRPIISIDGRHHLNETFFDEVEVPVVQRLGEDGQGWAITKFLLNNEHATTAETPVLTGYFRRMLAIAGGLGRPGGPLLGQPGVMLRLARFEAELAAVDMMVRRVAARHGDQSPSAHALGSMLKVRATQLQQKMSSFIVEMIGEQALVAAPPGVGVSELSLAQDAAREMFFRRASTIYGGASEVQRGIVAKLLFGF